jgi:hypothetical protein
MHGLRQGFLTHCNYAGEATMKIISGGQSGVDRAALEVAIARGIAYGGWCPRGGWAEDFPDPPGLLANYPLLKETPLADPAQRTEWNVRDGDAVLILVDAGGVAVSQGTVLARGLTTRYRKPVLVIGLGEPDAAARARAWLDAQLTTFGDNLVLSIGGPRASEAPGILGAATVFLTNLLDRT